jgi:glyoxylase-like metal-dependent hydrolase (beta-lactamase superfamily II)
VKLPAGIQVLERGWLSSNNILLYDGDRATLIDAGYVGHAAQTLELVKSALAGRRREFAKHCFAPAPVGDDAASPRAPNRGQRSEVKLTRLINTHSHSDHIGGNATLKAAFACDILIPAGIEKMVAEWDAEALLLEPACQRADRFAHDGVIENHAALEMGGMTWQALPAPGHDMSALVYYCAERRILISGDALWNDGFGIIFGELMGKDDALPATRRTLEMIAGLAVDVVIPGHGAPFVDVPEALQRAFQRLAAFETDGTRMGRNAVRACFTFNLLDMQRLKEDDLPAYLKSVPFFDTVNQRVLKLSDDDFASWLLGDLLRARAVEVKDGWILPCVAP